ncbi:hypothetical protein KUTeg_022231 [Tegillarca granosa]|uniref:Uncharacterized protein n=1 Tax=Tegillarca granosa TaxID=220873 RepID=A0ABQ9E600_TEGGR|nr:hypothetical protein KUTeg_022231 [Tegillarca granosa]
MYLRSYKKKAIDDKKPKRKFTKQFGLKIGQLVRISHLKGVFTRSYDEQWSYEVYKGHKQLWNVCIIKIYFLFHNYQGKEQSNFIFLEIIIPVEPSRSGDKILYRSKPEFCLITNELIPDYDIIIEDT